MVNTTTLLNQAESALAGAGIESSKLDAEVLLAHVLNTKRIDLHLDRDRVVDEQATENFLTLVKERAKGRPVAYLTGTKEFWSIPIKVTPDVLIPRPETEHIVEEVLKIVHSSLSPVPCPLSRILDLCTGSGCIVAALAKELPNANFVVTDISEKALAVARENLSFAKDRVEFLCGDLFDPISRSHDLTISRKFNIITANPPYIASSDMETLSHEITDFEPKKALDGGNSGLDFISKIIEHAPGFLNEGGWLVLEIGMGQKDAVRSVAEKTGKYREIEFTKDLAGIERVASMRQE